MRFPLILFIPLFKYICADPGPEEEISFEKLEAQYNQEKNAIGSLKKEIENKEIQVKEAHDAVQKANKTLTEKKAEASKKQEILNTVNKPALERASSIKKAEKKIKNLNKTFVALTSKRDELVRNEQAVLDEIQALKLKIEKFENATKVNPGKIQQLKDQVTQEDLENRVTTANSDQENSESSYDTKKREHESKNCGKSGAKSDCPTIISDLALLEQNWRRDLIIYNTLNLQLETKNDAIRQLQTDLDDAPIVINMSKDALKVAEGKKTNIEKAKSDWTTKNGELDKAIKDKTKLEQEKNGLNIDSTKETLEYGNANLEELRAEKVAIGETEKYGKLEKELSDMKKELDTKEKSFGPLSEKYEAAKRENVATTRVSFLPYIGGGICALLIVGAAVGIIICKQYKKKEKVQCKDELLVPTLVKTEGTTLRKSTSSSDVREKTVTPLRRTTSSTDLKEMTATPLRRTTSSTDLKEKTATPLRRTMSACDVREDNEMPPLVSNREEIDYTDPYARLKLMPEQIRKEFLEKADPKTIRCSPKDNTTVEAELKINPFVTILTQWNKGLYTLAYRQLSSSYLVDEEVVCNFELDTVEMEMETTYEETDGTTVNISKKQTTVSVSNKTKLQDKPHEITISEALRREKEKKENKKNDDSKEQKRKQSLAEKNKKNDDSKEQKRKQSLAEKNKKKENDASKASQKKTSDKKQSENQEKAEDKKKQNETPKAEPEYEFNRPRFTCFTTLALIVFSFSFKLRYPTEEELINGVMDWSSDESVSATSPSRSERTKKTSRARDKKKHSTKKQKRELSRRALMHNPFFVYVVKMMVDISNKIKIEHSPAKLQIIFDKARNIFLAEPSLVRIFRECSVVGDVHGQVKDVFRIFSLYNTKTKPGFLSRPFVFMGDLVDRGQNSVDVAVMLFCLKIALPDQFILIQGNHESKYINSTHGLKDEIEEDFSARSAKKVFDEINDVFSTMPVAALQGGCNLIMHGGIIDTLETFKNIEDIKRPFKDHRVSELLTALLWADGMSGKDGIRPNPRGVSILFGENVLKMVCERLKIKRIIRGHQVAINGYQLFAGELALSVFSAPNYNKGKKFNRGGVADLNKHGHVTMRVFCSTDSGGQSFNISRNDIDDVCRTEDLVQIFPDENLKEQAMLHEDRGKIQRERLDLQERVECLTTYGVPNEEPQKAH